MIDIGKLEAAVDIASNIELYAGKFLEQNYRGWEPEAQRAMLNARRDALLIEASLRMLWDCMAFVHGWKETDTARGFMRKVLTEAHERAERTRDLLVAADHAFMAEIKPPEAVDVTRLIPGVLKAKYRSFVREPTMTWPLFLDIAADLRPTIRELLEGFDAA